MPDGRTLGHESVGVIHQLGSAARSAATSTPSRWTATWPKYFVVPAAQANLTPIPDDLSDAQAVYTCDMLTTGFMGAEHACLRVTKAGGRVSNVGYHGENPAPLQLPLDAFGLGMNDKSIHTGLCPGGKPLITFG